MATLLFKFVFLDNSTPAAALTSTELTGGDAPTVNISKTTLAGGVVSSEVASGALTYDSYTRSWGYRLASADLATYLYVGMATTSYADAAQADVHALGIVVPDDLVSSRLAPTVPGRTADISDTGEIGLDFDNRLDTNAILPSDTAGTPGGLAVFGVNSVVAANVTYWNSSAVSGAPVSSGSGSTAYTITVQDEDSNPLDGVEVWISTDAAGTNVVAGTLSTDASGQATFMLDAGDYYVWRQLSGYNFTNPVAVTVS